MCARVHTPEFSVECVFLRDSRVFGDKVFHWPGSCRWAQIWTSYLPACASSTLSTLPAHLVVREHGPLCGVTCSRFLVSLFSCVTVLLRCHLCSVCWDVVSCWTWSSLLWMAGQWDPGILLSLSLSPAPGLQSYAPHLAFVFVCCCGFWVWKSSAKVSPKTVLR